MSRSGVDASQEPKDKLAEAFLEWLNDAPINLTAYWKHQHDQWFCLFEDYDVTGVGDDERAAYRDAISLLGAYFCSCFEDRMSVADARRPIPLRLKVEIHRDILIGAALKRIVKEPSDYEARTVVLPEQLAFNDRVVLGAC